MGTIVDLHTHTDIGSLDSLLTPERLVEAATKAGLSGVAITEHNALWRPEQVEHFRGKSDLFIYGAEEWTTNMGHIIVLGLDHGLPPIRSAQELRHYVLDAGGFMILAHPFRYFPGPMNLLFRQARDGATMRPEQLAEHPVFQLVDEIEVLNLGCSERENRLALQVARLLGKRGVAGSDAHSAAEVGRYATVFERELSAKEDLIAELRAGRFYAARQDQERGFVAFAAI